MVRDRNALQMLRLEERLTPVVGAFAEAQTASPGIGLDGVVSLVDDRGSCSGSLLYTGRHILTAAHCVDQNGDKVADQGVNVHFDLPGGRISYFVPPQNIYISPKWTGVDADGGIPIDGEDFAILTLPSLAPSGIGGADRYDLYRKTDELGQGFVVVGYGRSGIGLDGAYADDKADVRRYGFNRFDTDSLIIDGLRYAPTGLTLNADFDNGLSRNDAFGIYYTGAADLGYGADEVSTAPGDSGGPALLSIDNQYYIAGVASYFLNGGEADIDSTNFGFAPTDNNSFGDFLGYTRVSSYVNLIDRYVGAAHDLVIDLAYQPMGNDGKSDTIVIQQSAMMLSISINSTLIHTVDVRTLSSLTITGSSDSESVILDQTVLSNLPITTEGIESMTDARLPIVPPVMVPPNSPLPPPSGGLQAGTARAIPNASSRVYATGADVGAVSQVTMYDADGSVRFSGLAYDATFTGGVRVAVADVNGDGVPDLITAPGPGTTSLIQVFDGRNGERIMAFEAYESTFTGGVFITAADLDNDGYAEILTSPDQGGGPRVRIFQPVRGGGLQSSPGVYADFFGIEDPNFRGGARLSVGDINGDGIPDLLIGAGFGGGPRVAVFNGATLNRARPEKLFADFFIFEQTLRNGVYLSAGDLNGDGYDDLIAGGGPGGAPRIFAISGFNLAQRGEQSALANFFAGNTENRGGVRVVAKDLNQDGLSDLIVGEGPNDQGFRTISTISIYLKEQLRGSNPIAENSFAAMGSNGFGGVFVG